jgi:hypothetical protein
MIQIPIPRGGLQTSGELSGLASRRESGSLNHQWRVVGQHTDRTRDGQNNDGNLQRLLNRKGLNYGQIPSRMFPFKIYQIPYVYQQNDPNNPNTGLTFRVRTGLVFPLSGNPITPTGTDMVANPDIETYLDNAAEALANQIVVPPNVLQYWIWINVSGSTASIQSSATPATATVPWTGFPVPSSTSIPIGYVDTQTYAGEGIAVVRQILRNDFFERAPSGGPTTPAISSINNSIYQTVCFSNGAYAILGTFTQINGISRLYLAFLNSSLGLDTPCGQIGFDNFAFPINVGVLVGIGGTQGIMVCGAGITNISGGNSSATGALQLSAVDQAGNFIPEFSPPLASGSWVFGDSDFISGPFCLCQLSGGNAVVSGSFTEYGFNSTPNGNAIINGVTAAYVSTVATDIPGAGNLLCAATLSGFVLYVGAHSIVNTIDLMAYSNSGAPVVGFAPVRNLGASGPFGCACQNTGNIIIAGGNRNYSGDIVNQITAGAGTGIARIIAATGVVDATFATYALGGFNTGGAGYGIFAIAIDSSNRIYCVTDAFNFNGAGIAPNQCIRLSSNGTLDITFPTCYPASAPPGYTAAFNHVTIDPSGNIIIAGMFTTINVNGVSYARVSIFKMTPGGTVM